MELVERLKNKSLWQSGLFLDNRFTAASGGGEFDVLNPATGTLIGRAANANLNDCQRAIQSAAKAFVDWRSKTVLERSTLLKKWYELIMANQDDLALILTIEQGKPLPEAAGEIAYGASFIEWFAEECRRTYGDVIPSSSANKKLQTIQQPIGVVAAITPWNFPNAMITRKVAPAIAAGCTVVIKPAEDTPFSALALGELARQAGLPPGVINIIPTVHYKEIGGMLSTDPTIAKLSFTGSTPVGRILMEQAAPTLKKLSLELGGNAPAIIFEDADLETAVKGTIASKYRNAGQTCVCTNRILVQKSIYQKFLAKYTEAVKALVIGNGTDMGVTIGPLINAEAIQKVEKLLLDATDKGAKIILGGHRDNHGPLFFQTTIITGCTDAMLLSKEEIFGPVSAIYEFEDEQEAVQMANNTQYGLAAYFFTENLSRSIRVSERLEYGIVGINEGIISTAEAPFGGIKQSGFGKEGSHLGMDDYLITKYICTGFS